MLDIAQDKIDKNKKQIPKQALKDFPLTYADIYLNRKIINKL